MENKPTPPPAAARLRDWLKSEGRKNLWLADQVRVHKSTVTAWLAGQRSPTPQARIVLGSVTGLDLMEGWE